LSNRSNNSRNAPQIPAGTSWDEFDAVRNIRREPATLSPTTALLAIGISSVAQSIRPADGTSNSTFHVVKSGAERHALRRKPFNGDDISMRRDTCADC
jgi:hypothetical protein